MKVLIIGLGSIARKHITALKAIDPDVKIDALRSSKESRQEEGVRNIYNLLPDEKYDFIIISNPTSLHAETIAKVIKLKTSLFIEKPVFESIIYDSLIEEINDNEIITYVACNLRFLGCISFLHYYIHSHPEIRINEVNVYCGSHLPDWREGVDYRKVYSSIPEQGGGVHLDLIHELDYICWLFGFPKESFGIFRNVSSLQIRSYDYANYCLLYPEFSVSVVLNYYRTDYKRTLEIVFKDITWTVDLKANKITDSKGEVVYEGKDNFSDTYKKQLEYFIKLIRENRKAENDVNSAYHTLKIALQNERS
ncbi:MAG: Gfo/Idh/MocA family oxidoreductase [Muribaculaceae bacterium]|nr:Gfo/Idh/MocA family oxidoreductase [Muribaculaceae bacterium]